jgi:hypothetical protein
VTVNGKVTRRLAGSARAVTVSMAGRPKGTVNVVVVGIRSDGARYEMTRTFHLCVPAKGGGGSSNDTLRRV